MTAPQAIPASGPTSPPACDGGLCPDCEVQVVPYAEPWCLACGHIWSWGEVACPHPAVGKRRRHGVWLCRLHTEQPEAVP